jgi:hypothetical protein
MNKFTVSKLPGYESVRDLIPEGHFISFSYIWALRIESYASLLGELEQRFVLDLGQDWSLDDEPLVRITMYRPSGWSVPNERQICGLDIVDIRRDGLEELNFEVYDYEMSGFKVKCHSIELSKVSKPYFS